MILPIFKGTDADYPYGSILDYDDVRDIVRKRLTDEQIMGVALTISTRTREWIEITHTKEELRECISRIIANALYREMDPRYSIPVADGRPLTARDFNIDYEEVRPWFLMA